MRLLLTNDLHRDGSKLLWLLEEAPTYDALLVAGDLLDIFSKTDFEDQKSGTLRWRQAILNAGMRVGRAPLDYLTRFEPDRGPHRASLLPLARDLNFGEARSAC